MQIEQANKGPFLRGGFSMALAVAASVLMAGAARASILIDTVPVGNVGNAADTATGSLYGSVGYAYNIGKYEVTAGQYTAFLNAVGAVDTYALYNTLQAAAGPYGAGIARAGSGTLGNPYVYTVDTDYNNRPVNYVSFGDAMRFSNWLHNGQPTGAQDASTTEDGAYPVNGAISKYDINAVSRKAGAQWAVTSENEWYKAAYYNPAGAGSYYLYPTSSDTAPGRDITEATNTGNNANYSLSLLDGPIITSPDRYTTLVGEFQNSVSPYGTFDQAGNVREWNEAIIDLSGELYRGLRGGSWPYGVQLLDSYHRFESEPYSEYDDIGFRVSQIPEPASLALLGAGGLLLLRRRRAIGP